MKCMKKSHQNCTTYSVISVALLLCEENGKGMEGEDKKKKSGFMATLVVTSNQGWFVFCFGFFVACIAI